MSGQKSQKDLVLLTADEDTQLTMEGLFSRPEALGIRPITAAFVVHPRRDPGVFRQGAEILRPYIREARFALVVLDREGCGREKLSREEIEEQIEKDMARNGWPGRSAAVAIDPELEIWAWTGDDQVAKILGWEGNYASLEGWLTEKGFWSSRQLKPRCPKKALQAVLRRTKVPRSASLYKELARAVKLDLCTDPAFHKLRRVLREWFGPGP